MQFLVDLQDLYCCLVNPFLILAIEQGQLTTLNLCHTLDPVC